MPLALEEPPEDPDDWSEEQWLEWLATAPIDPETGQAHALSRARRAGGGVIAAAMLGLDQAIFGERPKAEVVVEVDADGLDRPEGDLNADDPSASWLELPGEAPPT